MSRGQASLHPHELFGGRLNAVRHPERALPQPGTVCERHEVDLHTFGHGEGPQALSGVGQTVWVKQVAGRQLETPLQYPDIPPLGCLPLNPLMGNGLEIGRAFRPENIQTLDARLAVRCGPPTGCGRKNPDGGLDLTGLAAPRCVKVNGEVLSQKAIPPLALQGRCQIGPGSIQGVQVQPLPCPHCPFRAHRRQCLSGQAAPQILDLHSAQPSSRPGLHHDLKGDMSIIAKGVDAHLAVQISVALHLSGHPRLALQQDKGIKWRGAAAGGNALFRHAPFPLPRHRGQMVPPWHAQNALRGLQSQSGGQPRLPGLDIPGVLLCHRRVDAPVGSPYQGCGGFLR